jgi:hypothetical protein
MLSALVRGGEFAWTIARAGLDQAWMNALAAVVELTGANGGADADIPAVRRRTFIADADVRVRVASALREDEALRPLTIVVESVYDGLVVLAGRVPALAMHRRAFEVAVGVPGVRRVMSSIDIAPPTTADGSTNAGAFTNAGASENAGASDSYAGRDAAPVVDEPFALALGAIDPLRRTASDASEALPARVLRRRRSVAARQRGRTPPAPRAVSAAADPGDARSERESGAPTG